MAVTKPACHLQAARLSPPRCPPAVLCAAARLRAQFDVQRPACRRVPLQAVNGILIPGGSQDLRPGQPFFDTVSQLVQLAVEANDKGNYFPVSALNAEGGLRRVLGSGFGRREGGRVGCGTSQAAELPSAMLLPRANSPCTLPAPPRRRRCTARAWGLRRWPSSPLATTPSCRNSTLRTCPPLSSSQVRLPAAAARPGFGALLLVAATPSPSPAQSICHHSAPARLPACLPACLLPADTATSGKSRFFSALPEQVVQHLQTRPYAMENHAHGEGRSVVQPLLPACGGVDPWAGAHVGRRHDSAAPYDGMTTLCCCSCSRRQAWPGLRWRRTRGSRTFSMCCLSAWTARGRCM